MKKQYNITFLSFNIIVSLLISLNNLYFIKIFYIQDLLGLLSLNILFYICTFFLYLLSNYIFYLLCFKKDSLYKYILFFLLIISFIITYYSYKYSVNFNDTFLINIINEANQISTVVSFEDIMYIIIYTIMIFLFLYKLKFKKVKYKYKTINLVILVLLFIIFSYCFKVIYFSTIDQDDINKKWTTKSLFKVNSLILHNTYYFKFKYVRTMFRSS